MIGNVDVQQSVERLQAQIGGQVVENAVGVFHPDKLYLEEWSAREGRPVEIDCDYCVIRVAGRATEERQLVRKRMPDGREVVVSDYHIKRFGLAWDAYLRGESLAPKGTPLENCDAIPAVRIPALKQAQIHTVEELLEVPDGALARLGADARALHRAASEWMAERHSVESAMSELEALRALVQEQGRQLEALKAAPAAAEDEQADDDGDEGAIAEGGDSGDDQRGGAASRRRARANSPG